MIFSIDCERYGVEGKIISDKNVRTFAQHLKLSPFAHCSILIPHYEMSTSYHTGYRKVNLLTATLSICSLPYTQGIKSVYWHMETKETTKRFIVSHMDGSLTEWEHEKKKKGNTPIKSCTPFSGEIYSSNTWKKRRYRTEKFLCLNFHFLPLYFTSGP